MVQAQAWEQPPSYTIKLLVFLSADSRLLPGLLLGQGYDFRDERGLLRLLHLILAAVQPPSPTLLP